MDVTAREFERCAVRFLYKTIEDGKKVEAMGGAYDIQLSQNIGLDTMIHFHQTLLEIKREDELEADLSEDEIENWEDNLHFIKGLRSQRYIDNMSFDRLGNVLMLMDMGVINSDQREDLETVFEPFFNLAEKAQFWDSLRYTRITNLRTISEGTCLGCCLANFHTVVDEADLSAVNLRIYCELKASPITENIVCSTKCSTEELP